jgi:hypothetical protein
MIKEKTNQKLEQVEYLNYFKDRFEDYKGFMNHVTNVLKKDKNSFKHLDLTFKEFVELSILVGNSLFIDKELYIKK